MGRQPSLFFNQHIFEGIFYIQFLLVIFLNDIYRSFYTYETNLHLQNGKTGAGSSIILLVT
jgi:hypothetical protein